jgi:hypothetical protein
LNMAACSIEMSAAAGPKNRQSAWPPAQRIGIFKIFLAAGEKYRGMTPRARALQDVQARKPAGAALACPPYPTRAGLRPSPDQRNHHEKPH